MLALMLALSAAAVARPLRGKTYQGSAPSTGISSERHRQLTIRAGGTIDLRVSRNGGSVEVWFSSYHPVLYCNTGKTLQVQSTKPARIYGNGNFRAYISERFQNGVGPPPIVQVVSGRFSGGYVGGSIQTNAGECGGVANFSARAR
jgi:hypothetical protein